MPVRRTTENRGPNTDNGRWDAHSVRGLRLHLRLTQEQLAAELGVRQQTVSEWETGAYAPRGASGRLLSLVADRADFAYDASGRKHQTTQAQGTQRKGGKKKEDGGRKTGEDTTTDATPGRKR